jgi:hypothetical protein
MIRRDVLGIALAGAAACVTAKTTALANLTDLGNGYKQVWVNQIHVSRQECPYWCWAAAISMIFGIQGHFVDQKVIVDQAIRGLVCVPAPSAIEIARLLSRSWTDFQGATFNSRVSAAYDFQARVNTLQNNFIRDELSNNRPLIYANKHHAMAVIGMDYYEYPNGQIVPLNFGVLDPWPWSPEFRKIAGPEITVVDLNGEMMFLAAVELS